MRAAVAAPSLLLALAGCGGAGETEADGAAPAGRQLFVSNCGSCHALADAGTNSSAGPSLDAFAPSRESVEEQVRHGGGGMPAFEGRLSDAEIEAVSTYAADHAGR